MKKLFVAFLIVVSLGLRAQVPLGGHTYVPSTTDSNAGQTNVVFTVDGDCDLTAASHPNCTASDTGGFTIDAPYSGTLKVTSTVSLTAPRTLTVVLSPGRDYHVWNETTGAQLLTIKGVTGASVSAANSATTPTTINSDGTNYGRVGSSDCTDCVVTDPSATQTITQPVDTTLQINSINSTTVNADLYAGADIGAKINAADAALGANSGTITVNTPGTLSTSATLSSGHSLSINVPVSINATITLAGGNTVSCASAGALVVNTAIMLQGNGPHIVLRDCPVTGTVITDSLYSEIALNVGAIDDVKVSGMNVTNARLLAASGTTNAIISHNIIKGVGGIVSVGVSLVGDSAYAIIDANTFDHVNDAISWFNADGDPSHPNYGSGSRAAVLSHGGFYTITNNICTNSIACYWGSVAHDVVITGNYAENCADVCYDPEGSIDVLISGNRGKNATNGVGATFFYGDHISFISNSFTSDSGQPLISIHNSTLLPSTVENLLVSNNHLYCGSSICIAVGGDPVDNAVIKSNSVRNGIINFSSYNGVSTATIENNDLSFDVSATSAIQAINIMNILNSGSLKIIGNTVQSTGQPVGSACISANANDFNSSVTAYIIGNQCLSGFPVDIATSTGGGNPGTIARWTLRDNLAGAGNVIHNHPGADQDSYVVLSGQSSTGGTLDGVTIGATTPSPQINGLSATIGNGSNTNQKLIVNSSNSLHGQLQIGGANSAEASIELIPGATGFGDNPSSSYGNGSLWSLGVGNGSSNPALFGIGNQLANGLVWSMDTSGNTSQSGSLTAKNLNSNGNVQLLTAGTSYLAYNEDNINCKFCNYYSGTNNQWGQGQRFFQMYMVGTNSNNPTGSSIGFFAGHSPSGTGSADADWTMYNRTLIGASNGSYAWSGSTTGSATPGSNVTQDAGLSHPSTGTVSCDTTTIGDHACNLKIGTLNVDSLAGATSNIIPIADANGTLSASNIIANPASIIPNTATLGFVTIQGDGNGHGAMSYTTGITAACAGPSSACLLQQLNQAPTSATTGLSQPFVVGDTVMHVTTLANLSPVGIALAWLGQGGATFISWTGTNIDNSSGTPDYQLTGVNVGIWGSQTTWGGNWYTACGNVMNCIPTDAQMATIGQGGLGHKMLTQVNVAYSTGPSALPYLLQLQNGTIVYNLGASSNPLLYDQTGDGVGNITLFWSPLKSSAFQVSSVDQHIYSEIDSNGTAGAHDALLLHDNQSTVCGPEMVGLGGTWHIGEAVNKSNAPCTAATNGVDQGEFFISPSPAGYPYDVPVIAQPSMPAVFRLSTSRLLVNVPTVSASTTAPTYSDAGGNNVTLDSGSTVQAGTFSAVVSNGDLGTITLTWPNSFAAPHRANCWMTNETQRYSLPQTGATTTTASFDSPIGHSLNNGDKISYGCNLW